MKQAFDSFARPRANRRKFMLGLFFCTAAGVAAWRQPRNKVDYLGKEKLEHLVPKQIGPWSFQTASGLVVPPNDELSDALYSQVLTRVYSDGVNPPIMLLIAQNGSQTGFLQVHRPETCYSVGGYSIAPLAPHPIQIGSKMVRANRMEATGASGTEHVIYWTRIGNRMPLSWRAQKLAVAEQNLEGLIPDAILVRVSMVSSDAAAATATIDAFVRKMLAEIPRNRLDVFVGE